MAEVWKPDTRLRPNPGNGAALEADTGWFRLAAAGWRNGRPTVAVMGPHGTRVTQQTEGLVAVMGDGSLQELALPEGAEEIVTEDAPNVLRVGRALPGVEDVWELHDGRLKHTWKVSAEACTTLPADARQLAFVVNLSTANLALDAQDGRTARSIPMFHPSQADPLFSIERGVAVADDDPTVQTHVVYAWHRPDQGKRSLRLLVQVDADWVRSLPAGVGFSIDPTIISTTTGYYRTSHRRQVRLSTGRLVRFTDVAGGVAVQVSDDHGETWSTCTTPASGIIDTRTDAVIAADPDADNRIHVLMGCSTAASQKTLDYYQVTVAGLVATVVKTQVEAAAGTSYGWQNVELVVHSGAAGATKNILMAYHNSPIDTTGMQYVYTRSATVTTAGVLALGTRYTVGSNSETGQRAILAMSKNASGAVKLLFQLFSSQVLRIATLSAPMTSAPSVETVSAFYFMKDLTGIDGMESCMWAGGDSDKAWFWHDQVRTGFYGEWLQVAATTYGIDTSPGPAVVGDPANNRLLVVARQNASPNKLKLLQIAVSSKTVTDSGVWGTQTVQDLPVTTTRTFDGERIPVFYGVSGGVYSDTYAFNSAPLEPSISITPAAFAASSGADITVTHNDTDQASGCALKFVDGSNSYWWRASDKTMQTSEVVNPASGFTFSVLAADLAGKLTSGKSYQVYAATVDSLGLMGPYNSTAVIANAGAKLTPVITSGATSNSAEYTATWTVNGGTSAYQLRVLNGAAEVSTTGKVASTTARARTLTLPTTGVAYTVELTVWDQTAGGGIASDPVTLTVTTSFTAPLVPLNVVAAGDAALAAIKLRWSRGVYQQATFARSSVAYLSNGTQVASGAPRYDTVGGVQGIRVEESATNLLTANQASVETDTAGFASYSATLIRTTSQAWHGVASLQVVCDGAGSFQGFRTDAVAVSPSTVYTVSLRVKGPAGASIRVSPRDQVYASLGVETTAILSGNWDRIAISVTTGVITSGLAMRVDTGAVAQAITWYADGLQIIQRAYDLSWHLPGTTRAAESVTAPTTNWPKTAGTIETWVWLDVVTTPTIQTIVDGGGSSHTGFFLHINNGKPRFQYGTGTVGVGATATTTVQPKTLYHLVARWDQSGAAIFVNGVKESTNIDAPGWTLYANAYLGSHGATQRWLNGVLGPVRVSAVALSDADIAAAYAAGPTGMAWTPDTVALYDWAGDLEGGNQNASWGGTWRVDRRRDGATDWTALAAVSNPASGQVEYIDRTPAGGKPYEYRIVAVGNNGTETGVA